MVDVQVLFKQVIGEDRAAVDTAAKAEYALHCWISCRMDSCCSRTLCVPEALPVIVELLLSQRHEELQGVVCGAQHGCNAADTDAFLDELVIAPVGFLERLIGCVLVRLLANRLERPAVQITKNMVLSPFRFD